MPTKRLFLLRHAKSSWDDPGQDDHDRPLAPRGRRAVQVIGDHLRANKIAPALVLCSTSRRTRETLDGVRPGGEQLIEPELYGADASAVLERLRRVPDEIDSVMVIGHNPAMQVLVLRLAAAAGPAAATGSELLAAVQRKFPTGALATLEFECGWSELAPDTARLSAFVRPKQLVFK
jgi:phosphohistidine phosphatase